jgi:hypothetical protein
MRRDELLYVRLGTTEIKDISVMGNSGGKKRKKIRIKKHKKRASN